MANNEASQPSSQPNGAPQAVDALSELDAVMRGAAAPGRTAGAESEATTSADSGRIPLSGKVLVEWDEGAHREVDVADLVKAARERSNFDAERQALESKLTENVAARAVVDRIGAMSEDQRNLFLQALADPSILNKGSKPQQRSLEEDLDDIIGQGDRSRPGLPPEVAQRLQQLEEFAYRVAPFIQEQVQTKQQATLAERVQAAMTGFDGPGGAFEKPEAKKFGMASAMRELAFNPDADVQKVVAQTAASLQRVFVERQPDRQQPTSNTAPTRGGVPVREKAPTAAELESGDIGRQLQQLWNRTQ